MKDPIKILFVEDVQTDAEMIWNEITKSGLIFKKKLVDNRKDFIAALKSFEPEFIISDYSMPQFDGMSALTIKNELSPDVPFILVTGSINEEIAVEAMKNGADDYVIKQNLSRLVPAIHSALKKWEIFREKDAAEKALKESEERFRMLFDKAPIGYQSLDLDGNFIEVNETWLEMLGYSREEVLGKWFGSFLAPDYIESFRERFPLFKEWGKVHAEFGMIKKDGSPITVAFDGRIGHTTAGEFKQTHCVLEDVTELRLAEAELKKKVEELEQFNDLSVGRELKMIELKKEINALLKRLGEKEKYKIVE